MKCKVCGEELEGAESCPMCGCRTISIVGNASEEQMNLLEQYHVQKRKDFLGGYRILVHGYNWEDQDGVLVEQSQEDFLINESLDEMETGSVFWGKTLFARTDEAESFEIGITIEKDGEKKNIRSMVTVPEATGLWKVGLILKPGLKAVLCIGDEEHNTNTQVFSLKG